MNQPQINVTPLIDVLLVLLIIFMVVTPTKPSSFDAKVPRESNQAPARPHPDTLVVTVGRDSTLMLNNEGSEATVDNPESLIKQLSTVFQLRTQNQAFVQSANGEATTTIQKTVFIKAPRSLSYGSVAKVVDAVKAAGADPVSLQIDNLD